MEKRKISFEQLKLDAETDLLKDGRITPYIIICTEEVAFCVDATEGVKDIDKVIEWTAKMAKEKSAYKVYFVSEVWKQRVAMLENKQEITTTAEAYQVLEIQQDSINLFTRDYTRNNAGIVFEEEGELVKSPDIHMFQEIQRSLHQLQ